MSDELELMATRIKGVKEAIGMVDYHFSHLTNRTLASEALAASRLELARVVDRHRKDRMHSDMKLAWEMAQKILKEAKELGDDISLP